MNRKEALFHRILLLAIIASAVSCGKDGDPVSTLPVAEEPVVAFTADGREFSGAGYAFLSTNFLQTTLTVGGNVTDGDDTITIEIYFCPLFLGAGETYSLKDPYNYPFPHASVVTGGVGKPGGRVYISRSQGDGCVTLSKWTRMREIAGTFAFVGYRQGTEDGDSLIVTRGKFSAPVADGR